VSLKISSLNLYPIKSCAGMSVSEFVIGEEGAEIRLTSGTVMDRGWMFVNPAGDFQTQRTMSQLALLKPVVEDGKFFLLVGSDKFEIPLSLPESERKHVQVWSKQLEAALVPGEVSRAASEFLKASVELVFFDAHCKRETLVKGKGMGVGTRFTDSQPYLLISDESLQDLNSKMKSPVGRERFRANIWISGAQYPYREDQYSQLDHANFSLEPTKPCARCKIITVDELLGKVVDSEPLKALAQFRRRETQVYFGQYFLSRQFGASIRVGDPLMPAGFMKEPL